MQAQCTIATAKLIGTPNQWTLTDSFVTDVRGLLNYIGACTVLYIWLCCLLLERPTHGFVALAAFNVMSCSSIAQVLYCLLCDVVIDEVP